eukprot:TRINITY_DN57704_c0_g1_i1.p1 TRINITY_DN57704_c0_g1~~TRINITY_DN57704_c0_g1_i1.p1  ORF type:complete len:173 (+),score=60.25 TRINITY_DN57704_c0_g1_i1:70-519(+)
MDDDGLDSQPSLNGIAGGAADLKADQLAAEIPSEARARRKAHQAKSRINTGGQGQGYLGGTGSGNAPHPAPRAAAAAPARQAPAAAASSSGHNGWLSLFRGRPQSVKLALRKPAKDDTTVDMGGTDFLDYLPKDKHRHKHQSHGTCTVS